jgi:hypothetical protein
MKLVITGLLIVGAFESTKLPTPVVVPVAMWSVPFPINGAPVAKVVFATSPTLHATPSYQFRLPLGSVARSPVAGTDGKAPLATFRPAVVALGATDCFAPALQLFALLRFGTIAASTWAVVPTVANPLPNVNN